MDVQAVFFDLDGTLMDHQAASDLAVMRLLTEYGHSGLSQKTVVGLWRTLEDEHMGCYLAGEASFSEQRRARISGFFEYLGERLSPEQSDEIFSVYLGFYEHGWRLFPDAVPGLDALGGVRKGVLTNGDPEQQRSKLEVLDLAKRFETVVVSGEVGASKPSRTIFREACARMRLEPSSCAYVGDRLETDARAAREIGMLGVWLDRGRSMPGGFCLADNGLLTIRGLTELPGHLGRR